MGNNRDLDLSNFSKELKILLLLMKEKNHEGVLSNQKEWLEGIDWDRFLQLARHHRVYPFIYTKLKEINETGIPPIVVQTLHREYQKNTFQMLYLSGEMEQTCKLFAENNIRSLQLKGPVLAADLYGDISLRTSRDLDILVPLADLEKAEKLLIEQGYVKDDYFSTKLNEWRWRHHHVAFSHPEKKIKLEIHWRLSPGPAKEPNFNQLWQRKRISPLTSYPVYYLGREDLFFFLVTHGARHGWSRLRWLADIDQLGKQTLDLKYLKSLFNRFRTLRLAGQAFILASQLLHTPLTEEMRLFIDGDRSRRLAQDAIFYIEEMVNLHTEPLPEYVARYHQRHLFTLMSKQQKLLFMMSLFYPYPVDAETLPLPKNLHFLYFPLRPFLWAWRKTRKHAVL